MDIQLHFQEKGSGEPLILLHGNGEDGSYFVHQMEAFSRHYRVIALDTRGHGQSPRGQAHFTLYQFALDLKAFMDEMNIPRAHILGFSDGGNIALLFALAFPGYVDHLILNGANLSPRGVKFRVQLPVALGFHTARFFGRWKEEARKNAKILGLMVGQPNISPKELAQLSCPTLVIAGEKDMIKDSHTRLIARSIPGASLVILPGDHFVANKQPQAFNAAVLSFLRA